MKSIPPKKIRQHIVELLLIQCQNFKAWRSLQQEQHERILFKEGFSVDLLTPVFELISYPHKEKLEGKEITRGGAKGFEFLNIELAFDKRSKKDLIKAIEKFADQLIEETDLLNKG